ncbi:hypothetical protein FHX44_117713 [Pseudonocardia hierapolitana]|uniref:Uncharacterized protein n=1 Tax=Pseudonocardia hierapolitana TaxID=1128676 RepID=A0A561T3T1_9PSEU|nr:hypothetical protein FHX44_117713 [Pseudonocardia hierapolitana]
METERPGRPGWDPEDAVRLAGYLQRLESSSLP